MFKCINIDVGSTSGKWHVILIDMLLTSSIGGFFVFSLSSPSTVSQAVAAGLGFTGLLSVPAKSA